MTDAEHAILWQVQVNGWEPSHYNTALRQHRYKRTAELRRAANWIAAHHAMQHPGEELPRFAGKVRVRIIRLMGHRQRELDHDGLGAWCKVLLDAIRHPSPRARHGIGLRIIEDDRPRLCHLHRVRQTRSDDQLPGFKIEVRGLLEDANGAHP